MKECLPSSPVVGTLIDNGLERENLSALSRPLSREVLIALRDAATALFNVASAALGETSCLDSKILPLSTAYPSTDSLTVAQCVRDFLHVKARAGKSDRYLAALRNSLKQFCYGRANTALADVTSDDIETWINGHVWSIRTRHGYLSDVSVLFNYAVKKGYLKINPAAAIELPQVNEPPPAVHSPETVKAILDFARSYDLRLCRILAIRYFSGLRSSEAAQLEEAEIHGKYIEVTAAKSKTRRRRLVTIQPNLRLWLDLGGELGMGDVGNRLRFFFKAAVTRLKVEFPHNVTRHSFVSYHLSAFQNAGNTALEAGHSEQILFTTYRELKTTEGQLITPEVARVYFNIVPEAEAPTREGRALRRARKRNWRKPFDPLAPL